MENDCRYFITAKLNVSYPRPALLLQDMQQGGIDQPSLAYPPNLQVTSYCNKLCSDHITICSIFRMRSERSQRRIGHQDLPSSLSFCLFAYFPSLGSYLRRSFATRYFDRYLLFPTLVCTVTLPNYSINRSRKLFHTHN